MPLSVSSCVWHCRIFARQTYPGYLSMVQALMTSRRASWVIAGLLPLVLHWLLKHLSWKRYLCHEGVELFFFLRSVWATLIVTIKSINWKINALKVPFSECCTLECNTEILKISPSNLLPLHNYLPHVPFPCSPLRFCLDIAHLTFHLQVLVINALRSFQTKVTKTGALWKTPTSTREYSSSGSGDRVIGRKSW